MREAHSADVVAIADVSLRSRRFARRGVYADDYLAALTIQDVEAAAVGCLHRERWRTWAAELDRSIVAYATAGLWSEDRTGRTAEIDDPYLDPEHFREGIGSSVLGMWSDSASMRATTQSCSGFEMATQESRRSTRPEASNRRSGPKTS